MTALPALAVATADLVTVLAFVVLAFAVVSAFLPGFPTGAVSLAGIGLYWWGSGFTSPGTAVLVVLIAVSLLAVAADWFAGAVAAKVGGASLLTTALAGLVGLALLFVTGPIGMVVGSAAVVFALEYRKHRDVRGSATAAGAYVVGFFASAFVQALLAFSVLLALVWVTLF
ncbi:MULTISPECIES: DUF456 domain-containing protein [Salinibaculum]|uniref:DUF456 domain-containing protein n=1 Tax=Salinibaculum TaxID=2732368 RepID=UPI0030D08370